MKTRELNKREAIFRYVGVDKDGKPKHVPNKIESKELRKLCAKTGLSKEELLEHKKYRKMLAAAAQTACAVKTTYSAKVLKEITKQLKLAKEHPDVLFVYHNCRIYHHWHRYHFVDVRDFIASEKFLNYLKNK